MTSGRNGRVKSQLCLRPLSDRLKAAIVSHHRVVFPADLQCDQMNMHQVPPFAARLRPRPLLR